MSRWIFRNYGLIDHYNIETADELARIDELDKARWAATSAPLDQFQCDPGFLAAMDADGNGRIRVNEVKAARQWAWKVLKHRDRLVEGSDELLLSDLDEKDAEGAAMKALASGLLTRLDSPARDRITLAQVRGFRSAYVARFPNGDGVVTAAQVPEDLRALLAEVLASTGGAADLSGEPGIRADDVGTYLGRVSDWLAWQARAEAEADTLFPMGEQTAAAATALDAIAFKVDQYFAQCALLALEANAEARLAATPEALAALDVKDPTAIDAWLAEAPLARPDPQGWLPLSGQVNARYGQALETIATTVAPWLPDRDGPMDALSQAEWQAMRALLAPYQAWKAAEPTGVDAKLGLDHLRGLANSPLPPRLSELARQDGTAAEELVQFNNLEKVVLLQRWLFEFANNFVSFPALFSGEERALFELGTLVIDGRKVNLCVRVTDRAAHKAIAAKSYLFVAYLDLVRKTDAGEKRQSIAAAVTAGTRGGIDIGKRGVFYDRDDGEWDALVVDVIAQPISVWEAMIAPFLRLRDTVAARVEKMASDKAASAEASMGEKAVVPDKLPTPEPAAPPPAPSPGNLQNLLIGGTVAMAAAGGALAFVVQTIAGISLGTLLMAILGLVLAVMAVFGFLGWLKIRRRDLATLLEACGWALNGRMRLTGYLASLFTRRPGLPAGAVRRWSAPRSKAGWVVLALLVLVLALVVAWRLDPDVLDLLRPEPPPTPDAPAE